MCHHVSHKVFKGGDPADLLLALDAKALDAASATSSRKGVGFL